jgi:hypothetical protein
MDQAGQAADAPHPAPLPAGAPPAGRAGPTAPLGRNRAAAEKSAKQPQAMGPVPANALSLGALAAQPRRAIDARRFDETGTADTAALLAPLANPKNNPAPSSMPAG